MRFQSAPGAEAGGNEPERSASPSAACFNPPPAVRPGGTRRARLDEPLGFNPPPAVRPGGTADGDAGRLGGFNPPPALMPGERSPASTRRRLRWFQSAPGDEAGGTWPRRSIRAVVGCFNPPPAVRPGGTTASDGTRIDCFNPPPAVRPGGTAGRRRASREVSIRPRR